MAATKKCSKCEKRKARSRFYKHPRTADGLQSYCIPCHLAANEASRKRNREADRQRAKRWRAANPDKVRAGRERYLEANRERINARKRAQRIIKQYDLLPDEYEALLAHQKGLCAICREPGKGRWGKLCIDHDHKTGKVRGLLCSDCNLGIGKLKDDVKLVRRAAAYLGRKA